MASVTGKCVLLLSVILLSACESTPKIVTVTEVQEVIRDRYVAIPESLTRQAPDTAPLSENFDVYELGAAYKQRGVRLQMCNNQLAEIAALGEQDE